MAVDLAQNMYCCVKGAVVGSNRGNSPLCRVRGGSSDETHSEEKDATKEEDAALQPLKNIVASEIDRQSWRGEMSLRAHHFNKREQQDKVAVVDPLAGTSQDLGKPLPLVQKDAAWKSGGWITSTAQQRRAKGVDGGSARLTVKGSSGD